MFYQVSVPSKSSSNAELVSLSQQNVDAEIIDFSH